MLIVLFLYLFLFIYCHFENVLEPVMWKVLAINNGKGGESTTLAKIKIKFVQSIVKLIIKNNSVLCRITIEHWTPHIRHNSILQNKWNKDLQKKKKGKPHRNRIAIVQFHRLAHTMGVFDTQKIYTALSSMHSRQIDNNWRTNKHINTSSQIASIPVSQLYCYRYFELYRLFVYFFCALLFSLAPSLCLCFSFRSPSIII